MTRPTLKEARTVSSTVTNKLKMFIQVKAAMLFVRPKLTKNFYSFSRRPCDDLYWLWFPDDVPEKVRTLRSVP